MEGGADLEPAARGEHLRGLVNLVQEHGEDRILTGLTKCERNEESAELVCATAHRSKGQEWSYVRLDEDFEVGLLRASKSGPAGNSAYESEARLVYVAMTRAKRGVQLPRELQKRFGMPKSYLVLTATQIPILIGRSRAYMDTVDNHSVRSTFVAVLEPYLTGVSFTFTIPGSTH